MCLPTPSMPAPAAPVAPLAPLQAPNPMALADNISGRRAGGISQLRIASQAASAPTSGSLVTIAGAKAANEVTPPK